MDYLPIQASSVPSERVFSSSAETDTKKRNRISVILMEALQMLKYDIKKCQLSFTEKTKLDQHVLLEDEPDEPGATVASCVPDSFSQLHLSDIIRCASHEEGGNIESTFVPFDG